MKTSSLPCARQLLRTQADPRKAKLLSAFFKTGKGEYGEGDRFLGVTVPDTRRLARAFIHLSLKDVERLFASSFHEERLLGLLILILRFQRYPEERKTIADFYLAHLDRVNNWDLVDLSAPSVLGQWLVCHAETSPLFKLVRSKNMWHRRVAILSAFAFIKKGKLDVAFDLARRLLRDQEDLIHKAGGWMLREAGKKDQQTLERFLKPRYKKMPRTMLRYAIERFSKPLYKKYLKGEI